MHFPLRTTGRRRSEMYEAFFEMTSTPFARNIPPEQLYENRSLREILGR